MAPVAATVALSHVEGVSDSARARELYKCVSTSRQKQKKGSRNEANFLASRYYQPNTPINVDPGVTAPNAASEPDNSEATLGVNVKAAITSSKISSPDTSLTAFCQLVTWRTGAQRAMLRWAELQWQRRTTADPDSLIDDATQYFIAESTKTVDLIDNTKHAPGDDIWMGCSTVSKAGRLCERYG
jgi:hypothetical protein